MDRGFEGCLADLELGDYRTKPINLDKNVIEASNVRECSTEIPSCSTFPCKNQGECKPLDNGDYHCLCSKGFG